MAVGVREMAWPRLRLVSALRTDLAAAQIGVSLRETQNQGGIMHRERCLWHTLHFTRTVVPQWRRQGLRTDRIYYPATRHEGVPMTASCAMSPERTGKTLCMSARAISRPGLRESAHLLSCGRTVRAGERGRL